MARRQKLFRTWYNLAMLAAESQQAIWLRSIKIAAGGAKAQREAQLMVDEKVNAAVQEGGRLFRGASIDSAISRYRTKVRANVRRLSK
jgi:hypothetical protein